MQQEFTEQHSKENVQGLGPEEINIHGRGLHDPQVEGGKINETKNAMEEVKQVILTGVNEEAW